MRCGNDALAMVASCVSASTHSADVAQYEPSIVVVARRYARQDGCTATTQRIDVEYEQLSAPMTSSNRR